MSQSNISALFSTQAAVAAPVSARDWLQWMHQNAWFRVVYDTDGVPILRSRSKRQDSGLIISSDPSLGGLIACPFESLKEKRSDSPWKRIVTYVQQIRTLGLGLTTLAWGPLVLTDYISDDPTQVYETPTTDPTTGLRGGDPATFSQIVQLWTEFVPTGIQDLDPIFVMIQQRADKHWLQQTLGDHHRITLEVDSAMALAECGTELYIYWPEREIVGWYQIVKMTQPLGVGAQVWECQFISRGQG